MTKSYNIYYSLLVVLLLWGCASQSAYKIKSFFFDGVPDPSQIAVKDTTAILSADLVNILSTVTLKVENEQVTIKKNPMMLNITYGINTFFDFLIRNL